jgi:hypothetical protein
MTTSPEYIDEVSTRLFAVWEAENPNVRYRRPGDPPPANLQSTVNLDEPAPRKRSRLDPATRALRAIEKNPSLVARFKPDGEIEITHKEPSSQAVKTIEIVAELDATADDEVWNAIAKIRDGGHGPH